MKTGKWILTMWLLTIWLAASAWAQIPALSAARNAAQTAAKASAGQGAASSPAAKPADSKAPNAMRLPKLSAKPAAAALASGPGTARGGRKSVAPGQAEGKPATVRAVRKGRDPFVSPIVERVRSGAACSGSGKRCLYVGDLSLQGIVQSSNGIIAVVVSGEHTYFLRENDPLADGDVERIGKDAITMRQRSSDILGRPVVREVTKKLGSPAV